MGEARAPQQQPPGHEQDHHHNRPTGAGQDVKDLAAHLNGSSHRDFAWLTAVRRLVREAAEALSLCSAAAGRAADRSSCTEAVMALTSTSRSGTMSRSATTPKNTLP